MGHQISILVPLQANTLLTELSHWSCSWILEPVLTAANLQVRGHLCFYLFNINVIAADVTLNLHIDMCLLLTVCY